MVEVTKGVMSFSNLKIGTKSQSTQIKFLRNKNKNKIIDRNIVIEARTNLVPITVYSSDLTIEGLSFEISKIAAAKIINQIAAFARDPIKVARHLRGLNDALKTAMEENNFPSREKNSPTYVIEGLGGFIPGAPSEDYQPLKKGRLLDKVLLEREMKAGINTLGFTPKLVGLIPAKIADGIIKNAQLFSENQQITRILDHGSYTHRLMRDALESAVNSGEIDLTIAPNVQLNFPQLFELLVLTKINLISETVSAWIYTIDASGDTYNCSLKSPYDSTKFSTSFRSAANMNSHLLCFGKELGLEHLHTYLLDNHYKEAYKIVLRVKQKIMQVKKLDSIDKVSISNEDLYINCMNIIATLNTNFISIGSPTFLTLTPNEALLNPNYEMIPEMPGVVKRKAGTDSEIGTYAGWADFFNNFNSNNNNSNLSNTNTQKSNENKPIKKGFFK